MTTVDEKLGRHRHPVPRLGAEFARYRSALLRQAAHDDLSHGLGP